MELLIILAIAGVVAVSVMFLKKYLHLTVEDENLSDKDDYLERRIKKDDNK
jgi:hypothetical protein